MTEIEKNVFANRRLYLILSPVAVLAVLCLILLAGVENGWMYGILAAFLLIGVLALFLANEPLFFVINEKGIKIVYIHRSKLIAWEEVIRVRGGYDPQFIMLPIKELSVEYTDAEKGKSCERIFNSRVIKEKISKYCEVQN